MNEEMNAMDMDVMGIASSYSTMRQNQVQMAVQTNMLKKSMDVQAQAAQDLLKSLPQQTVTTPSYLGRNIDIRL